MANSLDFNDYLNRAVDVLRPESVTNELLDPTIQALLVRVGEFDALLSGANGIATDAELLATSNNLLSLLEVNGDALLALTADAKAYTDQLRTDLMVYINDLQSEIDALKLRVTANEGNIISIASTAADAVDTAGSASTAADAAGVVAAAATDEAAAAKTASDAASVKADTASAASVAAGEAAATANTKSDSAVTAATAASSVATSAANEASDATSAASAAGVAAAGATNLATTAQEGVDAANSEINTLKSTISALNVEVVRIDDESAKIADFEVQVGMTVVDGTDNVEWLLDKPLSRIHSFIHGQVVLPPHLYGLSDDGTKVIFGTNWKPMGISEVYVSGYKA